MRIRDLIEASMPFGKPVNVHDMTFGFEAEFLVDPNYYTDEVDIRDFRADEIVDELGCDDDEFESLFKAWRETHPDGDVHEWIEEIGVATFWEETKADGGWMYTLKDDEIHQLNSWSTVNERLSEELEEDLGLEVVAAYSPEVKADNEYDRYMLIGDSSVGGDGSYTGGRNEDHGHELVSPVFHRMDEFTEDLNKVLQWMKGHDGIRTNSTCGLHINIGAGKPVNALKLLVFAGEKWMAGAWGREENQYAGSLKRKLGVLPNNAQEALAMIEQHLKENTSKDYALNLQRLFRDGFLEIRSIGNADYEMEREKIMQHISYFTQLIDIASTDKYDRAYRKKLAVLSMNQKSLNTMTIEERLVAEWVDGANLYQRDRERIIKDGKIVVEAGMIPLLAGFMKTVPDRVMRIFIRRSGFDVEKFLGQTLDEYNAGRPFGDKITQDDFFARAKERLSAFV